MTHPIPGNRVLHAGVTTTIRYDSNGTRTITKEPYSKDGILLDVGPGYRCRVLFDNGVVVDNIYIGYLKRLK